LNVIQKIRQTATGQFLSTMSYEKKQFIFSQKQCTTQLQQSRFVIFVNQSKKKANLYNILNASFFANNNKQTKNLYLMRINSFF
jgi:hypothetical protein